MRLYGSMGWNLKKQEKAQEGKFSQKKLSFGVEI
jgi:hypothetical protein